MLKQVRLENLRSSRHLFPNLRHRRGERAIPRAGQDTPPMSSSDPAVSTASVSSFSVSPVNALSCLGRLIVMRAT